MLIMKLFLYFVCFVGLSSAIYPDYVEYFYEYEGTVTLGIPEIEDQYAALGIKAEVVFQMKNLDSAVVQFRNVQVAEYNGKIEQCMDIPLDYSPMPDKYKHLDMPFGVIFRDDPGYVFIVPQDELSFISNIRKAILEQLPKMVLMKHIPWNGSATSFSVQEQTLFGTCNSDYTIQQIPPVNHPKFEGGQFFKATRQIDFDNCQDLVVLKRSGISNFTSAGSSLFQSLESRSSISHFVLHGMTNDTVSLLSSETRGDVIMNPFFANNDQLRSIVRKKLNLLNVSPITKKMALPLSFKYVANWKYEVATTRYLDKSTQKDWVKYYNFEEFYFPSAEFYLTGISNDGQFMEKSYETVLTNIKRVASLLEQFDYTDPNEMPHPFAKTSGLDNSLMMDAAKAIHAFNYEELSIMGSHFFQMPSSPRSEISRQLFLDILASTGSEKSIYTLMNLFKTEVISETRIALTFMTLTNQLVEPEAIQSIVDYAKTMNITGKPLLSSTVFVNVAKMFKRICLTSHNGAIEWELHNRHIGCSSQDLDSFVSVLHENLQNSTTASQQMVIIEAITNIGDGTELNFNLLKSIIADESKYSNNIRTLAVFGLEKRKFTIEKKDTMISYLTGLIANEDNSVDVCQAAFITALTWHPDASWWQMIARMSWHVKSSQLSALISLTIRATADSTSPILEEQAILASFATNTMKPVPSGVLDSYNWIATKYLRREKIDLRFHNQLLKGKYFTNIPAKIFSHLSTSFLGLDFNLFEVALSSYQLRIKNISDLLFKGFNISNKDEITKKVKDFLNKSQELLKVDNITAEITILTRMFDSMLTMNSFEIPLDNLFSNDDYSNAWNGSIAHYMMPITSQISLPTELGIPMITEISLSTLISAKYDISLKIYNEQDSIRLEVEDLDIDFRLSSKLLPRLKILAPWNGKAIVTGVDNVRRFVLPINGKAISFSSQSDGSKELFLGCENEEENGSKYTFFHASNIPFTGIKSMFPGRNIPDDYQLTVCNSRRSAPLLKRSESLGKNYTGFDIWMDFLGDVDYPFTRANAFELIRSPGKLLTLLSSPTTKLWQVTLNMNPSASNSTLVMFAAVYERNINEKIKLKGPKSTHHFEKLISKMTKDPITPIKKWLESPIQSLSTDHGEYEDELDTMLLFGDNRGLNSGAATKHVYAFDPKGKKSSGKISRRLQSVGIVVDNNQQTEGLFGLDLELSNIDVQNTNDLKAYVTKFCGSPDSFKGKIYHFKTVDQEDYEPVLEFSTTQELSKYQCEMITRDCTGDCLLTNDQIPLDDYSVDLVYDKIYLNTTIIAENFFSNSSKNVARNMFELFLGSNFPYVSVNAMDVNNPVNSFIFQAKRQISSPYYSIAVRFPEENYIIDEFRIPFGLDKLSAYNTFEYNKQKPITSMNNFIVKKDNSYCEFTKKSIRTFDGLKIKFPQTDCRQLIVIDHLPRTEFRPTYGVFMNMENNILVARMYFTVHAYIVTLTYSNFKLINAENPKGKVYPYTEVSYLIKDANHNVILEVDKRFVTFPGVITIKATKNSILFFPHKDNMFKQVSGACGNYDGNPNNDMVGPQGCKYDHKPQTMFGASWVSPYHCKGARWLDIAMKEVHSYQNTCDKV